MALGSGLRAKRGIGVRVRVTRGHWGQGVELTWQWGQRKGET